MFKIRSIATVALAALMTAGSVYAATPEPLSGNEPMDPAVTGTSATTRQAAEAGAVRNEPAAGQENEQPLVQSGTPETRAEVVDEVQRAETRDGGFPDQSGNIPGQPSQNK